MTATITQLPGRASHPAGKQNSRGLVWLSPEQVCEKVPGLTTDILGHLRKAGKRPRYYKPSQKTVIYEEHEIDDWIASTGSTPRT